MTNTWKIIILSSTFGTLGGVSALTGYLLSSKPTELVNRLNQEGFEILGVNSSGGSWEEVITGYRAAKKLTFTGSQELNKTEVDLKKNCNEILNNKIFKESNYLLARQWCVKKVKATEVLEKNYKILNSEKTIENENITWARKVEELKNAPDKFKTLKSKMKASETTHGENVTTLKKECRLLKKKETVTTSEEFSDVFEQIKNYCSIKKNY